MKSRERRERDFRRREDEFLDLARRLIIEQGYAGFGMDRLAEATEYSKGTVYLHFTSKEDVVVALACQSMRRRVDFFDRAARFAGRPRERMTAIGVAEEQFFRHHSYNYRSEQIIKLASLEERASPERTADLHRLEQACFSGLLRITNEAVMAGELQLTPPFGEADVCLGVWASLSGTFGVAQNYRPLLDAVGLADPLAGLRRVLQATFDGLGWRPLTAEWDYAETYQRIEREVFPGESAD